MSKIIHKFFIKQFFSQINKVDNYIKQILFHNVYYNNLFIMINVLAFENMKMKNNTDI